MYGLRMRKFDLGAQQIDLKMHKTEVIVRYFLASNVNMYDKDES